MKFFSLLVIGFTLFVSCSGSADKSSESSNEWQHTQLEAQIRNKPYSVEVRYYADDKNGLTVFSDRDDVTDSNDDGLIFAIFQTNQSLQFDFVENGERLGAKVSDWEQSNDYIKGSGQLMPENGLGERVPFTFTLKL